MRTLTLAALLAASPLSPGAAPARAQTAPSLSTVPAPGTQAPGSDALEKEARAFLRAYGAFYQGVYTVSSEASWSASTDVTPEHDGARVAANKALAAVTGSRFVIREARKFLARRKELSDSTLRQLDKVWLAAAENPQTLPDAVAKRLEAEGRQSSAMDSFAFCLEKSTDGACSRPTTANEIDDILVSSRDLAFRLRTWNASKEIGPVLKPGLAELRGLRNAVARDFGYRSYFDLQAADYGMSAQEVRGLLDGFLKDIGPLYEQLHCWTKHELASRYGQEVPKLIPAHWLGNRWAQSWSGIVEGVDLDPFFKGRTPESIVRQAEDFYVSMGFEKLPEKFWKSSDLYPVPQSKRKKNTHASAWHVDLDKDVRSLMSVEPDAHWFKTAHHELGHIYYFQAYSRPEVPWLLRQGANRAFHEGIGELISMASTQQPYLRQAGVLPPEKTIDQQRWLLNEALEETIAFLPWSAGTISAWEQDLYDADLSTAEWNARWWRLAAKYQGIAPPAQRGEDTCDGCTKTHVNDYPAYYYNYAVATVFKYQIHQHICRDILRQDPHFCNYYGSRETGDFLRKLMAAGATRDWRALLQDLTGEPLSTKPMMDYFSPLMDYLKKENAGRQCGW